MAISRPIAGQGDEVSMPGVDPLLTIPRSKVRVLQEGGRGVKVVLGTGNEC